MKFFILLACLAGALAFSVDDVDFDNLVPIFETDEWRAEHPNWREFVASDDHPINQKRGGRVLGGTAVAQGVLPYQVGILVLLSRQAFCGGSIVSNNFVLSAASCFPGDPNAVLEFGNVNRNHVAEFINAAQKILHPQYDASISSNDISLVRLVRPVTFTPNIRPVRLPNLRQVTQTFENQQGRISGWSSGNSSPQLLLQVGFAPVISQTACRIRFPNSATDRTLCLDGTLTSICSSDFGGPMTIQDADGITTQIGVASFVQTLGCARGWPAGFTRVTAFLTWIGQNSDVVIRDNF